MVFWGVEKLTMRKVVTSRKHRPCRVELRLRGPVHMCMFDVKLNYKYVTAEQWVCYTFSVINST